MEKMGRVKGGKRVYGYRKENRMRVMGRKRGMVKGGEKGGLWMEKGQGYRKENRGRVMGGKRVMVKGGNKGEGYEWEKWGWLLVGKRVGL